MTQIPPRIADAVLPADLAPGLYLIATPIGNLGDMTLRAIGTIGGLDTLYCEDTRVTGLLLQQFGLKVKLVAYDDHRAERLEGAILQALAEGGRIGLCSDAGMPLISDPGYRLVRAAAHAGHMVTSLPGANAVLTALQLSGLPTDRFTFHGFLPPKAQARSERLTYLKDIPITQIFYETGPRVADTLAAMLAVFGNRPAALARELTKKFETILRGDIASILAQVADQQPKGEIVLVIGGAEMVEVSMGADMDALLQALLPVQGTRAAADLIAAVTGVSRKDLYARALALKPALELKNDAQ